MVLRAQVVMEFNDELTKGDGNVFWHRSIESEDTGKNELRVEAELVRYTPG